MVHHAGTPTSCAGCGSAYGATQWAALPLVKRLGPGELAGLVNPWPAHLVVEARACATCGRAVSRLAQLRTSRA